jgi:phosphate transport system ATP-binding protein
MTAVPTTGILAPGGSSSPVGKPALSFRDVTISFGRHVAVRGVSLDVQARHVTTLVGPSGCGKTTLLRAVNRLHDHAGGRVEGTIQLGDLDIYGSSTPAELVRSRVGMVFQRPNPFPTMSIFDNVVAGLRFAGIRKRSFLRDAAEVALRQAALWDLVRYRLGHSALELSGGQQQRLCIARALAVRPEMLLMDEPCSALDPIATAKVEQLITGLAREVTVVLVTHNMFQAARVSDNVAVLLMGEDRVGELVEAGPADQVLHSPRDPRTLEYVSGKVG